MREDVKKDLLKGLSDLEKSLPILAEHCLEFGKGNIKLIDDNDGEIGKDLDTLAGIDGYQRWDICMRAIAGRAQRLQHNNSKPWNTFTIRIARPSGAKTEYEKRLWAVKHKDQGAMFPYWTMHSYLTTDGSKVLSIGLAKTEELYLWIERNIHLLQMRKAGNGGEKFLYIPWDIYKSSGLFFYEYTSKAPFDAEKWKNVLKRMLEIDFIPDDDSDVFALEKGMRAADLMRDEY